MSGRPPLGPGKDAAGVENLFLGRPVKAEVRFGGPAIGPHPAMQSASDSARLEVAAGRDHLDPDREFTLAFDLAQVGRLAGPYERFEPLLPGRAHDLHLQIPAAGGAALVVRRLARGSLAGVLRCDDRECVPHRGGREEPPRDQLAPLNHPEPILAQLTRLDVSWVGWQAPGESVGAAGGRAVGPGFQEAAADMQEGIRIEVAAVFPESQKCDIARMAHQPGGFMVQGFVAFRQGSDSEGDLESPAVGAEVVAWRW